MLSAQLFNFVSRMSESGWMVGNNGEWKSVNWWMDGNDGEWMSVNWWMDGNYGE